MQKVKPRVLLWFLLVVGGILSLSCEPADSAITKRLKAVVPRSGLVGEWLLNGTLNDTAGNNHGAQIVNFAVGRKQKTNEALSITIQEVTFPLYDTALQNLSGGQSLSLSVWFNADPTSISVNPRDGRGPFENRPGPNRFTFALFFENNKLFATVAESNNAAKSDEISSGNLVDSRWYHAVLVYDAGARILRLYVDGAMASSAPTQDYSSILPGLYPPGELVVGVLVSGGPLLVEQARLYNRALTASEVAALYHE